MIFLSIAKLRKNLNKYQNSIDFDGFSKNRVRSVTPKNHPNGSSLNIYNYSIIGFTPKKIHRTHGRHSHLSLALKGGTCGTCDRYARYLGYNDSF